MLALPIFQQLLRIALCTVAAARAFPVQSFSAFNESIAKHQQMASLDGVRVAVQKKHLN